MCNKPYYCCEASLKLSSKMYVYKTQFCSPECYGRYLEVKEAQRAAKEAPAAAGTAETAPDAAETVPQEPQRGRAARTHRKPVDGVADEPASAEL